MSKVIDINDLLIKARKDNEALSHVEFWNLAREIDEIKKVILNHALVTGTVNQFAHKRYLEIIEIFRRDRNKRELEKERDANDKSN